LPKFFTLSRVESETHMVNEQQPPLGVVRADAGDFIGLLKDADANVPVEF